MKEGVVESGHDVADSELVLSVLGVSGSGRTVVGDLLFLNFNFLILGCLYELNKIS